MADLLILEGNRVSIHKLVVIRPSILLMKTLRKCMPSASKRLSTTTTWSMGFYYAYLEHLFNRFLFEKSMEK